MVDHEAIGRLMAGKSWHKGSQILPIMVKQPRLQPAVVQCHVEEELPVCGEPFLDLLLLLALDALTLHNSPWYKARSRVCF